MVQNKTVYKIFMICKKNYKSFLILHNDSLLYTFIHSTLYTIFGTIIVRWGTFIMTFDIIAVAMDQLMFLIGGNCSVNWWLHINHSGNNWSMLSLCSTGLKQTSISVREKWNEEIFITIGKDVLLNGYCKKSDTCLSNLLETKLPFNAKVLHVFTDINGIHVYEYK